MAGLALLLSVAALSVGAPGADATTPVIAAAPTTASDQGLISERSDPFEKANRKVYKVSQSLDHYILRPVAVAYRRLLPKHVRRGVHNAMINWDEPEVFVNDVLQVRLSDAGRAAYRFGVNSTLGLAGIFDVAAKSGVVHHENGFAVTLGRYGVAPGPYIFVPFLGPSSLRDLIGAGVDFKTNPLTFIRGERTNWIERGQTVTSVVDMRANVEDDLQAISLTATDPYATLRSVYQQRMQALISGDDFAMGQDPDLPGTPEPPPKKATPEQTPKPAQPPPEAVASPKG